MTRGLVVAAAALAALHVASGSVSAQQEQRRPFYVIRTVPTSFPTDFKQKAKDAIEDCCGASVHAELSCPAEPCENILIEDTPHEFSIVLQLTHDDDLSRFGRARYFRGAKPDKRQDQVLDWLRALVKCDDIRHHSGAENRQKLSKYCQVCQLIETQPADVPPTKKPQ